MAAPPEPSVPASSPTSAPAPAWWSSWASVTEVVRRDAADFASVLARDTAQALNAARTALTAKEPAEAANDDAGTAPVGASAPSTNALSALDRLMGEDEEELSFSAALEADAAPAAPVPPAVDMNASEPPANTPA